MPAKGKSKKTKKGKSKKGGKPTKSKLSQWSSMIQKRAKELKNKDKSLKHIQAVKKASAELKAEGKFK